MEPAASLIEMDDNTEEVRDTLSNVRPYPEISTPRIALRRTQEEPRESTMRVKARTYDGTASWREYVSHFERVCSINGHHAKKIDYLWVQLGGTALSYAESLPQHLTRTYDALCEALEKRFGDSRLAEVYKAELRTRQRRGGETLAALGQEIRRLVARAYPNLPNEGLEEISIEKFREALDNTEQRMAVHRAHPQQLEDAVEAALDVEAWQVSEQNKAGGDNRRRARAVDVSSNYYDEDRYGEEQVRAAGRRRLDDDVEHLRRKVRELEVQQASTPHAVVRAASQHGYEEVARQVEVAPAANTAVNMEQLEKLVKGMLAGANSGAAAVTKPTTAAPAEPGSNSKQQDRKEYVCYTCGRLGHIARYCRSQNPRRAGNGSQLC